MTSHKDNDYEMVADSQLDYQEGQTLYFYELHPVFVVQHNFDSPLARLYPDYQYRGFPFCLTKIDGFPLLYHAIHSFYTFGVEHFTIVTLPEYSLEIESFVNSVTNSYSVRALISLNFCHIDIVVTESLLLGLRKPAQHAYNLFVLDANAFFFGIPESISFFHRGQDSTLTLLFEAQRAETVRECLSGACVLSEMLTPGLSRVQFFRAVREEMLGENYNNQLELHYQLIDATYCLELRPRLPCAFLLASEFVPFVCIDSFREMGIFDDLIEFIVEQSNVDENYLHPVVKRYYQAESTGDEDENFYFTDLIREKRRLCVHSLDFSENTHKVLMKRVPIHMLEIYQKVLSIQKAIYFDRDKNRNASFMDVGNVHRVSSACNCSLHNFSEIQLNSGIRDDISTFLIVPDTLQKMLQLTALVRYAIVYPYPYLAIKYATIDAQLVADGKKARPALAALSDAIGPAVNTQQAYIDSQKITSIFALAKDDVYLLGGLLSQTRGNYDSDYRSYLEQFSKTKNSTLGIKIECKGTQIRIEDSFIANSVTISDNSEIINCIVLEQAKIGGKLKNCIIGQNATLIVEEAENVIIGCGTVYPSTWDKKIANKNMG